ncbi:hypothetical protein ABIA99_004138 [Bradyrhizobium sp. LB12.1]
MFKVCIAWTVSCFLAGSNIYQSPALRSAWSARLLSHWMKVAIRSTCKAKQRGQEPPNQRLTPFPVMVANGTLHCGGGCALGDLCAEWLAFAIPTIALAFGWRSIFQEKMFAVWVLDFLFAYGFGILFQYFTIAPMRGLSIWQGLWAAVKADTISITAWQIGMYGFMAFAKF